MLINDPLIINLIHEDIITQMASTKGITILEAKSLMSSLTFKQYYTLVENPIIPPSGQPISPSGTKSTTTQPASKAPSAIKSLWPGKGSPVETGMTVGLKDPQNKPMPGTVTQVDQSAKGVKIKNPTTGKDEWYNIDSLEPFAQVTTEEQELTRLKRLAGISENCSAGATGASNVAVGVVGTSENMVRRKSTTEEKFTKEYTPSGPAKTIIGDTKPAQASGELSATLAASGKPSASRKNNGFKR
jgi:hypothetical protein